MGNRQLVRGLIRKVSDTQRNGGGVQERRHRPRPVAAFSNLLSTRDRSVKRWRRAVLACAGILTVLAVSVAGVSRLTVQTSVDSLVRHDSMLAETKNVAQQFGGEPIVILVESNQPRKQLDQQHLPALLNLEGKLSRLPDTAAVYGPATMLNQIAQGMQNLILDLTGRRDALRVRAIDDAKKAGASMASANNAGAQAVAQFDRRYGPLLVQALPAGLPTLHNAGFVDSVIYGKSGKPRAQWSFVVPSETSIAILVRPRDGLDQTANDRLVHAVRETVATNGLDADRVTVAGLPTVVSALGSSVAHEIPRIGGVAVGAILLCLLVIPWAPLRRRLIPLPVTLLGILMTLGVLGWIGRPLSLGVVGFASVLLGVGTYYPTYFAQRASGRTVLTVALATAASFASLQISPIPFVRDLGLMLALGVLVTALASFVLFNVVSRPSMAAGDAATTRGSSATGGSMFRRRPSLRYGASALAVLVTITGWSMLPALKLQTNMIEFATGLPQMQQARHVQAVIGSSGELDVVLRGKNVASAAAFEWARKAQDAVLAAHGDRMRLIVSPSMLLGFLSNRPTDGEVDAGLRLVPAYLTGASFNFSYTQAILSFGVNMEDVAALTQLRLDLRHVLPPPPAGYRVELAGLPLVAANAAGAVSSSRLLSNTIGIVAAGLVLAIGLRGRRRYAARAVVAGTIATGAGLCVLWISGASLSPMTAALGSLTAAVGCEFTILLSEAARVGDARLRSAVYLATATSALGYASMAVSDLAIVREFGILLAGAVILSVLAAAGVVTVTNSKIRTKAEPPREPANIEVPELIGAK